MWSARASEVGRAGVRHYAVDRGASPASFRKVLDAWSTDDAFCGWFNDLLAGVPFSAFRWETPALTRENADRPFELVVLDSPSLARAPDPSAFADQFRGGADADVLAFANLGGDAIMVVPRQIGSVDAYGHLAAFVRGAPEHQRVQLWRMVGEQLSQRLESEPVWLSTAGAGVSWLHVRLDDRPKYYGFAAYRAIRR